MSDNERSPWICHYCGYTSSTTESRACDQCYKITCGSHLQPTMRRNPDNGLYELAMICVECTLKEIL